MTMIALKEVDKVEITTAMDRLWRVDERRT